MDVVCAQYRQSVSQSPGLNMMMEFQYMDYMQPQMIESPTMKNIPYNYNNKIIVRQIEIEKVCSL